MKVKIILKISVSIMSIELNYSPMNCNNQSCRHQGTHLVYFKRGLNNYNMRLLDLPREFPRHYNLLVLI